MRGAEWIVAKKWPAKLFPPDISINQLVSPGTFSLVDYIVPWLTALRLLADLLVRLCYIDALIVIRDMRGPII